MAMRVVLFLSRFAFICNIAFLLFVLFSWMEVRKPVKGNHGTVIEIPFAKELIIILGVTAIFISLVMAILYIGFSFSGKLRTMPQWLIFTNVLFFLAQLYYFFLM